MTQEDRDRWLASIRTAGYDYGIPGFDYKVQLPNGETNVGLLLSLVHHPSELETGQRISLGPLLKEARQWATLTINTSRFNATHITAAGWFIERSAYIATILKPNYGFMDDLLSVNRRIGTNPREVAWPWMLLGSEHVVKLGGRDHVLKTPAWKVEELPYGAITIQAAENPFTATRAEVRQVAEHLGLENPR